MSGLREAFDEIVADVPTYGDLDRAMEQAGREQRRRAALIAGLAVAAVVLAVVIGALAVTRGGNEDPRPIGPTPPTRTKSQSPETWADTAVSSTTPRTIDWEVPDPLVAAREAWVDMVAEHLDPSGGHLERSNGGTFWEGAFAWPDTGSIYPALGKVGLHVEGGAGSLYVDPCRYLHPSPSSNGTESCSTRRLAGPNGEPGKISRYERRCGAFDGSASAYATCGDYTVAVAVKRRDGLIGYLVVDGRGFVDTSPFTAAAMAAAAADPRLVLPEVAYTVPSDRLVASVAAAHFPAYRLDENAADVEADHPGYATTYGKVGSLQVSVSVRPAGDKPACGRAYLVACVERRVYGADDPTTVFVGEWDERDWADCCPRNSRAWRREFVYVGPRHTVVVGEHLVVKETEPAPGTELDQRLIDLALDPRLQ